MNKKNLYNKIMKSISNEVKKTLNEGLPLEHHNNDDYDEINYIFDLDDLLTDNNLKLLDMFPLKVIASGKGFGGPFMINEDLEIDLVEKTPSRTYSIEEVANEAWSCLGLQPGFVISQIAKNNVITCVLCLDKFDNEKFVIDGMKAFGWSYAFKYKTIFKDRNVLAICFDPMFQDAINEEIKKCSLLHHWTPSYNYENIMKFGLKPKSENYKFSYPPKIHLIKGFVSDEQIMNIGVHLCNANKDTRNDRNYVLLNVNAKDLLDKIDFFYDPRYEWGYYTKQPIDKQYISKNMNYHFE